LIVNKEASETVVGSLTRAGARLVAWTLPAELGEPKIGPKINHDDILAFHLAMENDSWREELAQIAASGQIA
jgi:hypothetical protein